MLNTEGTALAAHGFVADDARRWRALGPLEAAVTAYCQEYAERRGAKVVIESWPLWYQTMGHIRDRFPSSMWLYGVRDPRAVWWSAHKSARSDYDGSHALTALIEAERLWAEHGRHMQAAVYRYETVVTDTEREVRRLWTELGVDPDKGWLEYDPARDPHPKRWSWVPNATQAPDRAPLRRWYDQMPAGLQEAITRDAAAFIKAWDYTPACKAGPATLLRKWLNGASITTLKHEGKGAPEDWLRAEFGVAMRALQDTREDIRLGVERINQLMGACEGTASTQEWEMFYLRGVIDGAMTSSEIMGHIANRAIRRIMR
jgi:hypothetical protein